MILFELTYFTAHKSTQRTSWKETWNIVISRDDGNTLREANMWIVDMFEGTGIAAATQQCAIQLSLSTKPLKNFFKVLKSVMKHNFFLCVFTMAGTVMALYYQTFIEKLRSCPIKLAYGQSGTGKTTALHYGLGLMGVHNL